MEKIDWRRFLLTSLWVTMLVFAGDIWFNKTAAMAIYTAFPLRDAAEVAPLLPLLFASYYCQISLVCLLFLRLYPRRGAGAAVLCGLWSGAYLALPSIQYYVTVKGTTLAILGLQAVEGVAIMAIALVAFDLGYRPRQTDR